MGYLVDRYKGTYRLMCEYDKRTNEFPTKLNGTYEDIDVFISCYNDIRIFYKGRGVLTCYIPSLKRGHNLMKQISDQYPNVKLFNIEETDSEVLFDFKSSDDFIIPLFNPKTSAAHRSPFSSKNLPKSSYVIPEEDLVVYKMLTSNFSLENGDWLKLNRLTQDYIKSLANRKNTLEKIKQDMKQKSIKGKEYIHYIGKWNNFIEFLQKELKEEC